jgi:hypothetical protein
MAAKPETIVHFTVSMWNRFEHMKLLLANVESLWEQDPAIRFRVCMFPSNDASIHAAWFMLRKAKVPACLTYHCAEFGNGLGHNVAAGAVPLSHIICAVAVDIVLPEGFPARVRANVVRGKQFYFPEMYQQCPDGSLVGDGHGGALMAAFKTDWDRVGGLQPPRAPWGGDATRKPEDVVFEQSMQRAGLEMARPDEKDLYCRHHARSLKNPFYAKLKGAKSKKPWMTFCE